ncbi:MAG: YciI family protein [Chloroflexota bacterium]|nr:YciI family protein [Chloroflexota bacterium]
MKYVILIYNNPASRAIWEGLSTAARAEGLGRYMMLNEELTASGELIVSEALADPVVAKRVTVHEGQLMTTDGPFAEAKEQLAGFFLLECESIERAIELASRVPESSLGLVEVRPVMDLKGFEM